MIWIIKNQFVIYLNQVTHLHLQSSVSLSDFFICWNSGGVIIHYLCPDHILLSIYEVFTLLKLESQLKTWTSEAM